MLFDWVIVPLPWHALLYLLVSKNLLCFFLPAHLPSVSLVVSYISVWTNSLMDSSQSKVPPPLQVPPSRARRQFALRLAQRKAQLESTREQEEDPENPESPKTQEQEEREGHQRFARMFEGIDDSSDDGSVDSIEGVAEDEDVVGMVEVEGVVVEKPATGEAAHTGQTDAEEEKGKGKEGEDSRTVVV